MKFFDKIILSSRADPSAWYHVSDVAGNFFRGISTDVNFLCTHSGVEREASQTELHTGRFAASCGNISVQAFKQDFRYNIQSEAVDMYAFQGKILQNGIHDGLIMHDPAEQYVLEFIAKKEIFQMVTDVVQNESAGFFRDDKGEHGPAPVSVEESGMRHELKQ